MEKSEESEEFEKIKKNEELDLTGVWHIRLESGETGELTVPGAAQEKGYGEEIGPDTDWVSGLHDPLWYLREEYRYGQEQGTKVPFLSQPPRHYIGKAWYTRSFQVPAEKDGAIGRLYIECVKWRSEAWLDGQPAGADRTLCAPHEIPLGRLSAGEHTLTVCIDNSMQLPYRPDGHGVTEALGGGWNGMAGRVCVKLRPAVEIREIRVYPDCGTHRFEARICVENHTDRPVETKLSMEGRQAERVEEGDQAERERQERQNGQERQNRLERQNQPERQKRRDRPENAFAVTAAPGVQWFSLSGEGCADGCWDEFTQDLEEIWVTLRTCFGEQRERAVFGFREIRSEDGLFLVNGRPTYFRGTHFGGDYPISGYPECGADWWRDKMRIIKEWGLNFIRFHSYCPPEAAFQAADEAGVYLQVECGMWNVFTEGEDGGCPMADEAFEEAKRILRAFGNHPSFVMLSPSNEPGGNWLKPLTKWVERCRREDGRRLYTIQSGWPYPVPPAEIEGTDYVYFHRSGYGLKPGGTVRNAPGWKGKDYRESLEGVRYPVICHELGQWCSYPDYGVIDKFRGYLRPGNFEVFRESLKAHGMEGLDKEFAHHSGRLQTLMYKEELEANLRTPHMYGFELLDLHDYLGQGTALVGILDAFWQPKGYITPEEWREFCGETVLLARLSGRVFTQKERVCVPVEICHFGKEPLGPVTLRWKLTEGERELEAGSLQAYAAIGKNQEAGRIELAFPETKRPGAYLLTLELPEAGVKNHWSLWVYPEEPMQPVRSPLVTVSWHETRRALEAGESVLFCPPARSLDYNCPPFPFRPAFWNSQMGPAWGRGMGIICDAAHPAFADFPTDAWADWQWEQALQGARGFNLEHLPEELPLLVRAVDEWNRNLRLGLLFECRVGKGKLMLCSLDLLNGLEKRPAARWLLSSLKRYMTSEAFQPEFCVTMEALWENFFPHCRLQQKGGRVFLENTGNEDSGKLPPAKQPAERELPVLLDGDGSTFVRLAGGHPYALRLEWEGECEVKGLYYFPRQNERNHEGEIRSYRVEALIRACGLAGGGSCNGIPDGGSPAERAMGSGRPELGGSVNGCWRTVAEGTLPSSFAPKRIFFDAPVRTDRLRLTVLDGFGGERVRRFHEEQDGWHSEREPWRDTVFAAAALDILTDEEPVDELTGGTSAENLAEFSVKSATAEIDI